MSAPAAEETLDWTRERVLALVAVNTAVFAFGAGLTLALPLLSLVIEARGISSTWNGLNSAMAGVSVIVVTPFITPLARRFGAVPLLIAAAFVSAISLVGFYVIEPFWAWFPLRFLLHGGLATLFVLSEFWINSLAPPKRRGLLLGIYATILSFGFATGPLILKLTGSQGFAPFAIGAAVLAAAAIPFFAARRLDPALEEKPSKGVFAFVVALPTATVAVLAFGAVEAGGTSLLPVYGVRLGHAEGDAALFVTAVAVGNMLTQIPLGLLADRVDRLKVLGLCALGGLVGAAALPFVAHSVPATLVLLVVWGGIIGGLYTVGLVHLGSRYSGTDLAAANAAFVMMYAAGMTLGLPTLGAGLDIWNPHGIAVAMAAFFVAYLGVVARALVTGRG